MKHSDGFLSHITGMLSGVFSSGGESSLRGGEVDAQEQAMLEVQRMIDMRTQGLAQKICADC